MFNEVCMTSYSYECVLTNGDNDAEDDFRGWDNVFGRMSHACERKLGLVDK